ncbi:DNA replication protein psf2 [Dissophora globulifera]|uniref:DNA replication complex GINS protein PSF2 n=1 Tax=Dissophora globulifera TaxID=979702 RepID=A0A9P6RRV5_9FUNG|nr:DNA replication protein psf2 [Dissophora globulifera]KAG0323826.1 DNA replication protein psf2 [Dissophora globulifera]
MALPRHLKNGLTPLEIEFLAENEMIEIAAAIDTKRNLELLGGEVASLKPLQVNKVPLWMAITLKKKQKCNIVVPQWMTIESLQKSLKEEQEQDRFSALPYHYMETAQLLLENACDDIPSADAVRTLLKDLREARQSKARQGVAALGLAYLQMDNIGLMEINEIRPFFTKAFYEIQKLRPTVNANEIYGGTQEAYGGRFNGSASVGSSVPETSRFNASQSSRN